jgi:phosphoglycolate phosphatase
VKEMHRYALVVFDWDGTLVDSAAHIVGSIQAAAGDLDLAVPSDRDARHIIGLGLIDAMEYLFPGLAGDRYALVADRYRHHYVAGEGVVKLFEGVEDGLARLAARGHLLAVATGKSRRGLDRALNDTGLGRHFHATRCGDEGFPKPHPDMLEFLCDELGVERDGAVMVGDTTHDLHMAQAAGIDAVAVAYGAHDPETLRAACPTVCLDTPAELWQWLDRNA